MSELAMRELWTKITRGDAVGEVAEILRSEDKKAIAEFLAVKGAKGETMLAHAAQHGRTKCVGFMAGIKLIRSKLDKADDEGKTALMRAAENGHADCVNRLIGAEASLDLQDGSARTAAVWAAFGGHHKALRALAEGGADLDIPCFNHETALTWAAYNGHADCVAILVDAGADASVTNCSGRDAGYWAKTKGHADCVKALRGEWAPRPSKAAAEGELALALEADDDRGSVIQLMRFRR